MTLYVRCECFWNVETKELSRDASCPVHTTKK